MFQRRRSRYSSYSFSEPTRTRSPIVSAVLVIMALCIMWISGHTIAERRAVLQKPDMHTGDLVRARLGPSLSTSADEGEGIDSLQDSRLFRLRSNAQPGDVFETFLPYEYLPSLDDQFKLTALSVQRSIHQGEYVELILGSKSIPVSYVIRKSPGKITSLIEPRPGVRVALEEHLLEASDSLRLEVLSSGVRVTDGQFSKVFLSEHDLASSRVALALKKEVAGAIKISVESETDGTQQIRVFS